MANCWKNVNLNELNYNEICRLCLSHGGIMSSIFSSPGGVKSVSLPSRIMAFTSIKMETGDGLPGLICHSCLFNVERVYEFKMQCEQSDTFLRKHLTSDQSGNLKLKEEIERNHDCNISDNDFDVNEDHDPGSEDRCRKENISKNSKTNNLTTTIQDNDNDSVKMYSQSDRRRSAKKKRNDISLELEDKDDREEEEDCDDEGSAGEENGSTEPVVMIVDPNEEALDENLSDNDVNNSDNGFYNEGHTDHMNEFSPPRHWLEGHMSGDDAREQTEKINSNMRHNCPSCNKPFSDAQLLERHTIIHTQEPPFPCDYCDEIFNDRAGLKSHWRDHAGPRRLSCMACGEAFTDRAKLAQHVTIHDEVKPFHCNVCNKAFTYRSDLRKHSVIHTGARPYVCNICNKSFTRSTNLNKHARAHAGNRPFACSKCPKMFSSRADLTRHAVIHTGEKPYACGVCGLAFNRKDKLTRHVKLHTEDRPHACIECPTSFHRKEELTKHVQFHHFKPDPEFITEVIMDTDTEDIPEKSDVSEKHNGDMETALTEGDTEDVVISVDPFQLNNTGDQSQYDQRAQLLFSCGICHKRFSDKTYLRKHRLIHSELKPHVCGVCQKGFYRRRELVRHEAVHTGYKPFNCAVCRKPFARRDKLARHEKTHKYNKPYECSKCHETFNNINNLLQHEIIHNTSLLSNVDPVTLNYTTKAYKCFLCPASYARNENLIKHMKTHRTTYQNQSNKSSENLLINPVDYLTKMNPELNVTIKRGK